MKNDPKVSIIILNYNGLVDTRVCLKSLLSTKYTNFNVFIVDNGSRKNEARILKSEFKNPRLKFVRFNKNWGFAEGNNKVLRRLSSKYVVFLNNDTKVTPDWLTELILEAERDGDIAVVQSKILSLKKPSYFEYAGAAGGFLDKLGYPFARGRIGFHLEKDVGQYNNTRDIFWASGTCMMVQRDVFIKLGGFDKEFFAYQEEIDYCWRVKRAGYRVICAPKSVIYHLGMGTSFKLLPQKTFWVHRNNLKLIFRNMSFTNLVWVIPLRLVLDWLSTFFYLITGRFRFVWSVFRAHINFFLRLKGDYRKRLDYGNKFGFIDSELSQISIYWQYFVKGKRRFSEIVENRSSNTDLAYYEDLLSFKKVAKHKKRFKSWLFFLVIIAAFSLRIPSLSLPLDRDEGTYAYIGWSWLEKGRIPYKDVFDHKPPLPYLVYGLLSAIGGNNLFTIRVASLIYFFFTFIVFYFFVGRWWGNWAAVVLSLILLWLTSSPNIEGWGFNTESLFLPWILLGFGIARELIPAKKSSNYKWFFVGLLGGIAGLFKQVAYIPIFGLLLIIFLYDLRLKRINIKKWIAYSLGVLLPAIIAFLYFYMQGAYSNLYITSSIYNSAYLKEGFLLKNVQYLTGVEGTVFPYLKWIIYLKFEEVLVALVLFFISSYLLYKNKKWVDLVFPATLVIGLIVGAKLGGVREVGHYYLPVVWGLLFSSGGLALIRSRGTKNLLLIAASILVVVKIFTYSFIPGHKISKAQFGTQEAWFSDSESLGKYLKNKVGGTETLYVWANEPQIYYYAERISPSYFLHFYVLGNYPGGWDLWEGEIYENRPDFLVTYRSKDDPMYSELAKFLGVNEYSELDTVGSFRILKKD